ncbi:MAG: sigma-54 dependent transcriptional regulator [Thermodesulfobacteriota bacterium]|nr:MAG: sigma-54 dependent transcriptional regulator [Thermodesulfobacteriota bacterium]
MLKVLLVMKEAGRQVAGLLDGHNCEVYSGEGPLLERVAKNHYNIIAIEDRLDLVPSVRQTDPRAEVFLIGSPASDEAEAIRLGATVFAPMPIDLDRLKGHIENAAAMAATRVQTAELERQLSEKYTFAGVVGRNPRMLEIFNYLRRVAPYYKTLTVTGETGSGKEEVAKALHAVSPASKEPFVVCNCASLVESLIESELFGHKKGSFTGAIADSAGIFEAAGQGTVFLDEIGDLPLSFQPHLLRVLQNGDFRRVGSSKTLKARCKVIAATNRDLSREVREGRFREDLFFRLTPLTIEVPPLRARKDDIPLLCRLMLNRFHGRTGKRISGISTGAQTALMGYDWPGNVRELENVIENMAIMVNDGFIRLEDLPEEIRASRQRQVFPPKTLGDVVKGHIAATLRLCEGNRTNAAKTLGISRRALFRKMERYGID